MITIDDIAKAAGVSHGTVSNVLNKKGNVSSKRIRLVEDAIASLGYSMNGQARILRKGSTNDLALLLPDLESACYTDFYSSFLHQAEESGYNVRLHITEHNVSREQELASRIRSESVCGAAVFSCLESSAEKNPYAAAGFAPRDLLYVERCPFTSQNYIGFDYAQCATLMAKTAIRKQFHSIILFTESTAYSDQKLFADTFIRVVEQGSDCQIRHVQTSMARGYSSALFLLDDSEQPEAVFVSNIVLAQQLKNILYNFHDVTRTLVYTASPLYTMPENQLYKFEMNYHLLGKRAAEQLIRQIETPAEETDRLTSTVLPVEGTRIWAHYADSSCPRKKLSLLVRNMFNTDVIRNLSYLYTKNTNVEISVSSFTYDDLYRILNQNEGGTFDLLCLDNIWLSHLAKHLLVDLTTLDPGITALTDTFCPGLTDTYTHVDGTFYSVPYSPSPQILFYRKDLFESAIIRRLYFETFRQELRLPETFTEYNQIARFFTRRFSPASPVKYGMTLNLTNISALATEYLMRYFSHAPSLFDAQNRLLTDTDAGHAALSELIEAQNYCRRDGDYSWRDAALNFLRGDVAMGIFFSNYMSEHSDNGSLSTDKIGFCQVPGHNALLGGTAIGISRHSRHKEDALDFIRYLCREEISSAIAFFGGVTGCQKVYENYEIINRYPWLSLFPHIYAGEHPVRRPAAAPADFDEQQLLNIIGLAVSNALSHTMTGPEALRYASELFGQSI